MENIHDNREHNKFGLSIFLDDLSFTGLDSTLENSTKELHVNLDKALNSAREEYEANTTYFYEEILHIEEQLSSIAEMKIIHLYKEVEINTKKLIKATFNADTHSMYKWESLLSFLDGKGVSYKELNGYEEVNQVRAVNNHLKHWVKGHKNKINHIPEFTGKEINHEILTEFYNRTKSFPIKWILELRDSIYDNLYIFNDVRLNNLVDKMVLRMDRDTMKKFVKKFENKY